MIQFLIDIFPSLHEWGTWFILFTAACITRWLYKLLETETRKFRKKIIHAHVENGHKRPLKTCSEGNCSLLSEVATADHF